MLFAKINLDGMDQLYFDEKLTCQVDVPRVSSLEPLFCAGFNGPLLIIFLFLVHDHSIDFHEYFDLLGLSEDELIIKCDNLEKYFRACKATLKNTLRTIMTLGAIDRKCAFYVKKYHDWYIPPHDQDFNHIDVRRVFFEKIITMTLLNLRSVVPDWEYHKFNFFDELLAIVQNENYGEMYEQKCNQEVAIYAALNFDRPAWFFRSYLVLFPDEALSNACEIHRDYFISTVNWKSYRCFLYLLTNFQKLFDNFFDFPNFHEKGNLLHYIVLVNNYHALEIWEQNLHVLPEILLYDLSEVSKETPRAMAERLGYMQCAEVLTRLEERFALINQLLKSW